MLLPSKLDAHQYLSEAAQINPGAWVNHSKFAAQAAYNIASRIDGMDPDAAYIMGLLHDIGRRAGIINLSHAYTGYFFMMQEGYPQAARICITHSFIDKNVNGAHMYWDGTTEELETVKAFLNGIEYDLYDHLIQLCDAVSVSSGYWLIEKRLLDVGLRRGTDQHAPQRWQALLNIKELFDQKLGFPVYKLLPGVIKNTFGYSPNGKDSTHV